MVDDTNNIIRNINEKLAIKTSQSKRRKVVTLTNIKKGTLLLIEKAFVSVIKDELKDKYCNYCYVQKSLKTKLSRCSRCRSSYYCSRECQRKAYKFHKSECTFLVEHPTMLNSRFRFIYQILQKIKEDEEAKKYLNELMDHYQECFENDDDKSYINGLKHLAECEKMSTGYEGSLESLMKLINKVDCNALGISNEVIFSISGGLFLQLSNINHNCKPNCTFYFKGDTIYVKAVKDLAKGEEVTISYIPFYDSCRNRQENLKNYYFTCQCSRCIKYKDQLYLDPMEGIKCQTKGCDGYISHVEFNPCPKCHQNLPPETKYKVKDILKNFNIDPNNKLTNIVIPGNIENQIEWLENLLEEQKKLFHPDNLFIFATLNKIDNVILDNDLQQYELFKSKKTMINYEIYRYCQNQSLYPSNYNTFKMYNLLTNALNEILDYKEAHHLRGEEFMSFAKKKLDAIQCSTLIKQLESEMSITYEPDYIIYKDIQYSLRAYRDLDRLSLI